MNTRLALHELVRQHGLQRPAAQALFDAAGLDAEPPAVRRWLWPAVAVLAAALLGLGVILWLAANWESLGRAGRFALLQGVVVAMGVGAALRPALRPALGLLALLCIGGLFAYFGQTYQTGADAWQLFAVWAVLALPLCLGARSDVLWAPWALVVMTGISLWTFAHTGHRWRVEPQDLNVYTMAWAAAVLTVLALSPIAAPWTGAGPWAMRTAATLGVVAVTISAIGALFHKGVASHYPLALLLFGVSAAALAQRRAFEIFTLSAVALGLNTLLVTGLARWIFDLGGRDYVGKLLLLGLVAAGLLAVSVSLILKLARRYAVEDAA